MNPDLPPPVHVSVAPQPEPGFTVTLREVWDELRKVSSKLDTIHDLPGDVRRLEESVRTIEDNYVSKSSVRWFVTATFGALAAMAAVLALLIQR
jgi:hypothetical protein